MSDESVFNLQQEVSKAVLGNFGGRAKDVKELDAAGNMRQRNPAKDFELSKQQRTVMQLLDSCSWARRYVNMIQAMGSVSKWRPYYKGEVIEDAGLQEVIDQIRPPTGSQLQMRKKALRLQASIGVFALEKDQAVGRVSYQVWHPEAVKRGRSNSYNRLVSDEDHSKEVPVRNIRRFWVPDDVYRKRPHSELLDVSHYMKVYAEALEQIETRANQAKIFNNVFHAKLDQTSNEWFTQPGARDADTGKLQIEQSLADLDTAVRRSFNGDGQSRFSPYVFLFPGDLNHIKLTEPLLPDQIQALNMLGMAGAAGLPGPTSYYVGAEGTANHWNEAANSRLMRQEAIQPAIDVHDEFFNEYAFQPRLRARAKKANVKEYSGIRIDDIEMRSDTSILDNKPDNSEFLAQLYNDSFSVSRKQVADAAGEPCADLPDDVTEYEHWLNVKGQTQATIEPDTSEEPASPGVAARIAELLS